MRRTSVREALGFIALGLLPPALTTVLTGAVFRGPSEGAVDFERGFERGFISGFQGNPYDVTQGFRWTKRNSFVHLENLPRSGDLEVEIRLQAPRPSGQPPPAIWFTVDGRTLFRNAGRPELTSYTLRIPMDSTSLNLGIHSETIFVRGLGAIGVQAHSVRFRHLGIPSLST